MDKNPEQSFGEGAIQDQMAQDVPMRSKQPSHQTVLDPKHYETPNFHSSNFKQTLTVDRLGTKRRSGWNNTATKKVHK